MVTGFNGILIIRYAARRLFRIFPVELIFVKMKRPPCLNLTAIAILINICSSQAQVSLVKDINTSPAGLRPANDYTNEFCACGDYLFFPATTDKGKELWRTDGTASGTILLKDINLGMASGFSYGITCNGNGSVLFSGFDEIHGRELWVSDGTTNGTRLIKDLTPGVLGAVDVLGRVGNMVFLLTDHDLDGQREIWQSDGTTNNTTMVNSLANVGPIHSPAYSDTHVFFTVATDGQQALWGLNGVNGNLEVLVQDTRFNFFRSVGERIMFSAYDPVNQNTLWMSDGTAEGTLKVKGFDSNYLQSLLPFNDKVIFTAGGSTWISDGTEAGTVILTNGYTHAGVTIGDYFFGFGYDFSVASTRLFKSDGTTVEITYLDGDLPDVSMHGTIPLVNNNLILQHYHTDIGTELSISDDTHQNFTLLKDIKPGVEGSEPRGWGILHDRVFFLADDGINGHEIWSTDGTAEGTALLKNIATGTANALAQFGAIAVTGDKLHLLAGTAGQFSPDLYMSDGTEAGTTLKFNFEEGSGILLGRTDTDLIYFNARKLYKTNGSSDDVTLVKDLSNEVGGFGYSFRPYYTLGNKLIFALSIFSPVMIGNEYWVTDGTDEGTHMLKDIYPGSGSGSTGNAAVLGSMLVFDGLTPDTGSELWSSDGTEAGTILLMDINPGDASSKPSAFTLFKNKIVFSAFDDDHGREMWVTDGTAAGTVLLADVVPGAAGSEPVGFTVVGDQMLFAAYDEELGWGLWKTDGTSDGTIFVSDIEPGKEIANVPTNFKSTGDKLYFTTRDAAHGAELWTSDGTASGTYVIDRIPGPEGSYPSLLTPINGLLYFKSQAGFWRTNGTVTGTLKVADLEPMQIVNLNNWIYFSAPHPEYGVELFKVEFTKVEQQITFEQIDAKVMGDSPFAIQAAASSGLPVIVASEEELDLAGTVATIMKPGTVTVTVQQPGDGLFNPAPPVTQTFCIYPAKPVITLSSDEFGDPVLTSSADAGNQWFRDDTAVSGETQKTFHPIEDDTYKVQVTLDGCTGDFSNEMNFIVTGVQETNAAITFYPNPATETVHIKANNAASTEVTIVDMLGKPVTTYHLHGNDAVDHSLAGYAEGLYVIMVTSGKQVSYRRLVKH